MAEHSRVLWVLRCRAVGCSGVTESCYAVIRSAPDGTEWIDYETIRASEEGARLAYAAAEKYAGRTWSKDNPPVKIREYVPVRKSELNANADEAVGTSPS